MVGLQTLDLAIGVRVPASQPIRIKNFRATPHFIFNLRLSRQPFGTLRRPSNGSYRIWPCLKVGIVLGDGQYHSAVARGFELEVLIFRSFRKPNPLATRYRAVVLTGSKHAVVAQPKDHCIPFFTSIIASWLT